MARDTSKPDLSLAKLAKPFGIRELIDMRKQHLAEDVADGVLRLFRISVIATVALTIALAAVDTIMIAANVIEPESRLVTEHVLMAIIGASVVQVGSAIIAIVYSLFARPKDAPSAEEASQPEDVST
jgi:hypothetical protein